MVKMNERSKSQKTIPKKNVCLELLHQRIWQISKRSFLDGDVRQ